MQHGVFAREQLVAVGVTRGAMQHRVRTGRWERAARGVYRLAGVPGSWEQELMVQLLAWGAHAVASHRSAAVLWGYPGVERGLIELTVPRGRGTRGGGIVHRSRLPRADITRLKGVWLTAPARTIVDLAAVVARSVVEEVLDHALRERHVTIGRLRARLAEWRHKPGVVVVRELLAARSESRVPQSVFETQLLRVLVGAGLPKPVAQHRLTDGGRLLAVVDLAYPDAQIAIEADGYRWHSGRAAWQRDLGRRNRLTLLGWRIVHVTWWDLEHRPAAVTDAVRRALAASPTIV